MATDANKPRVQSSPQQFSPPQGTLVGFALQLVFH